MNEIATINSDVESGRSLRDERPRLALSASFGRSSERMVVECLARYSRSHNVVVVRANTGGEDERSLIFGNKCDKHFNTNAVWVEAVVHPEDGVGTTHKIVTFETASRKAEPFEAVIKKYGIPNKSYPHCTRELKTAAFESYLESIGWETGSYDRAIGLRADELDRIDPNYKAKRYRYPLMEWNIKKPAVMKWWRLQPFDLDLPEHEGNCVTCWKKTDRKLFTLIKERPQAFEWNRRMEALYGHVKCEIGRRVFFRKNRSTEDMFKEAERPFTPWTPTLPLFDEELDVGGACGDSCEIGADTMEAAE